MCLMYTAWHLVSNDKEGREGLIDGSLKRYPRSLRTEALQLLASRGHVSEMNLKYITEVVSKQ